jgi:hypothetical protein
MPNAETLSRLEPQLIADVWLCLLALHDLDERARSAVQSMVRDALRRHRELLQNDRERPKRWSMRRQLGPTTERW